MSEKDTIHVDGTDYPTSLTENYRKRKGWQRPDPKKLHAVIPGTIVEVCVKAGQKVDRGRPLVVLEAMKMRNDVLTPRKGLSIAAVHVATGDVVTKGQLLVEFE